MAISKISVLGLGILLCMSIGCATTGSRSIDESVSKEKTARISGNFYNFARYQSKHQGNAVIKFSDQVGFGSQAGIYSFSVSRNESGMTFQFYDDFGKLLGTWTLLYQEGLGLNPDGKFELPKVASCQFGRCGEYALTFFLNNSNQLVSVHTGATRAPPLFLTNEVLSIFDALK